jgi:hypothetical protein
MIGGHYQNDAFFVTKARACEQGDRLSDQALVRVGIYDVAAWMRVS